MAATHSCIRTSKTKASLCNIPDKTNASCKGTGYYLQKSPWIWLQFAQWPSMFLPNAGWLFLGVCLSVWVLQLIATVSSGGMDSFQRVCEPRLHSPSVFCFLWFSIPWHCWGGWVMRVATETDVGDWVVSECIPRLATCIGTSQLCGGRDSFLVRGHLALK